MSAMGGGSAEAKRQEVVAIKGVTDALAEFRAIINDTARSSKDLGAAGEATVAAIKGTGNALNDFARTGLFAAGQSLANSAAAGASGNVGASLEAAAGAAGSSIPILGGAAFDPAYGPVNEAVSRTSSIMANLARLGVDVDDSSIATSIDFTYAQGKRAQAANQRVTDVAKAQGLYGEAATDAGERIQNIGGGFIDWLLKLGHTQQ